jgi:hypothetical protein
MKISEGLFGEGTIRGGGKERAMRGEYNLSILHACVKMSS